ncbi:uncharacterized protein LOC126092363 isoform X1 [Schistocerca cancellata]|uniref:uncharacterized protein LOC126092363 isoform X1 n=1 Tax=Schistocerca cancellata TaxID=274614 RepID=UPI00211913E9|nr:uncharacterized protein LOC126092363 isoform X1 [Schistocerca cancellata]XP_049763863.1 uncharacterized protein LOC126092363 isoform X1 [Schistocerca cancellata]
MVSWAGNIQDDPVRRTVLEGHAALERTANSLARSQAIAAETETLGGEVIAELGEQRESLLRSITYKQIHGTAIDTHWHHSLAYSWAIQRLNSVMNTITTPYQLSVSTDGVIYQKNTWAKNCQDFIIIKKFLQNAISRITVNGQSSSPFKIGSSVRHGCLMSMALFTTAIVELHILSLNHNIQGLTIRAQSIVF